MPDNVSDYARVANDLRAKIRSGELRAGVKLPTKRELMEEYSVSGHAIDSAMLVLRTEGFVVGHQGRGRYVAEGRAIGSGPVQD
jgi:DNA-binding GntR family transcriptional regulator